MVACRRGCGLSHLVGSVEILMTIALVSKLVRRKSISKLGFVLARLISIDCSKGLLPSLRRTSEASFRASHTEPHGRRAAGPTPTHPVICSSSPRRRSACS
jgi:hypothetical protein